MEQDKSLSELLRNKLQALVSGGFWHDNGVSSVHIILNPRAGKFSRPKGLQEFIERLGDQFVTLEARLIPCALHITDAPGHASLIAAGIVCSDIEGKALIVSIGGDGTHQEVLTGLMLGQPEQRARVLVFRFPCGTGNDAADAWTVEQAIDLLKSGGFVGFAGAISFCARNKEPHFSFNIASLGIDAYVVHLTNRFKSRFPGNSYKFFTDMGVLFYNLIHGISEMKLRLEMLDGTSLDLQRANSIVVLGVSGFRTYGNEKWVLPAEDNFCAIRKGGLIYNLRLKSALFRASHDKLEGVRMGKVWAVEASYENRIPVQLDGEVLWLGKDDFPIRLEVLNTGIQIVSAKELKNLGAYSKSQRVYEKS